MLCFVLFFFNLTRAVLVHKYTSTQGCYYTEILVHWDTSTQGYWYTGMLENRDTSTRDILNLLCCDEPVMFQLSITACGYLYPLLDQLLIHTSVLYLPNLLQNML